MDADGEIYFTPLGWAQKSDHAPRRTDMPWLAPSGKVYIWDGDDIGWVQAHPPPITPCKEINHG